MTGRQERQKPARQGLFSERGEKPAAPGRSAVVVVGRVAPRRKVHPVLHEAAHVIRLAPAVGEDHRDVRDEDRAYRRHQDQPPQVGGVQRDGDGEADHPDAHHDQVPVLPVPDVLGHRPARLGDQVHLLSARGVTQPHPSTLSCFGQTAYTIAAAEIKGAAGPASSPGSPTTC